MIEIEFLKIKDVYRELFNNFISRLPEDVEVIETIGGGESIRYALKIKGFPTVVIGSLYLRDKYFTIQHSRKNLSSIKIVDEDSMFLALDSILDIYCDVKDPKVQISIYIPKSVYDSFNRISSTKLSIKAVELLTNFVNGIKSKEIEIENKKEIHTIEYEMDDEILLISGSNLKIVRHKK